MNAILENDLKQTIRILESMTDICDTHMARIEMANDVLAANAPFTAHSIQHMNQLQLGMSDLLIHRFSKLQDTIGEKIFPLYLTILGENVQQLSFIDRLNLLEKLRILPSTEQWRMYRLARNAATHEYPDKLELMAENLNRIIILSKELCLFWLDFRGKLKQTLTKESRTGQLH